MIVNSSRAAVATEGCLESRLAPDPMASSLGTPTSPLADYEDEDEPRDRGGDGAGGGGGLHDHHIHPDSPDMMEVEAGDSLQLSDFTFDTARNKEGSEKTEDSLSTKARQFIEKNKNRTMDERAASGVSLTTTINADGGPPPTPAPSSCLSHGKEKMCNGVIDFPPQFFTIRAARLRAANCTALGDAFGMRRGGGCRGQA
jgi:hypothetical protein